MKFDYRHLPLSVFFVFSMKLLLTEASLNTFLILLALGLTSAVFELFILKDQVEKTTTLMKPLQDEMAKIALENEMMKKDIKDLKDALTGLRISNGLRTK